MATRISERDPVRPFRRVSVTPTNNAVNDAEERPDSFVAADHAVRTGAVTTSGATQTKVPDLLGDWQKATLEATADMFAREELQPELDKYVENAKDDDERETLEDEFFEKHAGRLSSLTATHLADLEKQRDRSLQKIVLDMRPMIASKKDPFTPLANRDPQARAKEKVLWENSKLMVIVDLFAQRPKALVIPKQPAMFPVELPNDLLNELARVAANVSDAFMDVGGCPASGIWINPPQHLMVKQLHVHVSPKLPRFTQVPLPLVRADHASYTKAMELFDKVTKAIESKLGPST